ncbi:MAG: alpha-N-acetylglucosaminidase [Tidjanibacter sp.]|nr:alpha-N-acetylglucosaminidase [Tidjanibacter sp.]
MTQTAKSLFRLLWVWVGALLVGCAPDATQTTFSLREQTEAAEALVERVTDGRADDFRVVITQKQVDGKDYFALYADPQQQEGVVVLEGSDGVCVASALNHYLQEWCGCHISWCGSSVELPERLPLPQGKTVKTSPYKYRYCFNYCTFNYTMSWWDKERWQWEIDFMALNGINMPLAVTGQNSVWQRVYRSLGFTDKELEGFFSGPAYFNWFWMGNLDGWGGPLPQSFFRKHEALQKYILRSERALGMKPVLPAFTGHVPPSFEQKFPDVRVRKTSWVNFPEVAVLDPEEEMFDRIGEMFIREQAALYGTNHLYSADTFNENDPPSTDSAYLAGMSRKVFESMRAADSEAVWVMQGWLFHHSDDFWGEPEIKALLGAVPDDGMIILDLWSERFPVWQRTEAYYGKPWIWCMLHNFGQNITLSGNSARVAQGPASALASPKSGKMCGIGLTPEGIEHNPMMFAMMLENVWREEPIEVGDFVADYLEERYGGRNEQAEQAWGIIAESVYNNDVSNGGPESIITGRPNFKMNPGGTTNVKLHYDQMELATAWDLLMECAEEFEESEGYRYDLVDITRQVMANHATVLQQACAKAYKSGDIEAFDGAANQFISYLWDFEELLSSREELLLGRWLEAAKAMGTNAAESGLYEQNARNLLTTWGNKDCRIRDYACRQWSGMVGGFYIPRWERFFASVREAMSKEVEFDQKLFDEQSKEWEWEWTFGKECYPTTPQADEIEVARKMHSKYRSQLEPLPYVVAPSAKKIIES